MSSFGTEWEGPVAFEWQPGTLMVGCRFRSCVMAIVHLRISSISAVDHVSFLPVAPSQLTSARGAKKQVISRSSLGFLFLRTDKNPSRCLAQMHSIIMGFLGDRPSGTRRDHDNPPFPMPSELPYAMRFIISVLHLPRDSNRTTRVGWTDSVGVGLCPGRRSRMEGESRLLHKGPDVAR